MNEKNTHSLPMNAMKEIPQAKPDAKQIVGLVKSGGRVSGYKLSDGQVVDKMIGVQMARMGDISGVGISIRNGNEYLKSIPDGSENNNLGNLPSVTL